MNRNPLIPFVLIMVMGVGLIFFLSVKGLGDMKEVAKEKEGSAKTEETVASNPEDIYKKSCIACHGANYEGGVGPGLKGVGDRLSVDQIKDVLVNGVGSMPGGLVPADQAEEMAKWLVELK